MHWPRAADVLPKRDAATRRAVRDALDLLRAGLDAVEPERATAAAVAEDTRGWRLGVRAAAAILPRAARLHVLAVGKAAPRMASEFARRAPVAAMVVVAPKGAIGVPKRAEFIGAGHPLPDAASLRAGRRALELADSLRAGDALVVLVSGGASSLLEDPAVPRRDYVRAIRSLLRAGVPIEDLNAVRKHLSNLKGGLLAIRAAARGVPVVGLLLSDVPSNRVDAIGSGLTAPDPTTFADALRVLQRANVEVPPSVLRRLRDGARGRVAETPKPGALPFARVTNAIVASNATAVDAMRAEAERRLLRVVVAEDVLRGPAWLAGQRFARTLLARGRTRPLCLVAGGETTVRVRGRGRGGRNQEFALGAATVLAGKRAVVAAFGTDGVDGTSPNAGAIVDGRTTALAAASGIDVERVFARNDSAALFRKVGGALRTGATGTNVADVAVGILFK